MASNKGDQRNELRNTRLTNKHSNHDEEVIHNDFLRSCRKQCDDAIKAFVECSKREGLLVVFRCRGENAAMSECLRPLTTPENYEKYKAKHGITMGDKPASAPAPAAAATSSRARLP